MKKLILGNYAVAQGLIESGTRFVSSYPGTPSTEITEEAARLSKKHGKDKIYCEWAPNEKVALEAAIGASIRGVRAFSAMKHVGLNVAADPLFTASYTGVSGGLVIAVADDPGAHSSQNEQDSRHYAIFSKLPMLEPSDSSECIEFTKKAFEISEKFDTPVLLRLVTRISHSQSIAEVSDGFPETTGFSYKKDAPKYVMVPAFARKKHIEVEKRNQNIEAFFAQSNLNTVEINDGEFAIITSGTCFQYAKEALGDKASYLKLSTVNPIPSSLIKDYIDKNKGKKVIVIEELDPVIERFCLSLSIPVYMGKTQQSENSVFTPLFEYSASYIKEKVLEKTVSFTSFPEEVPPRPPVLCAGCPHRGVFYVLQKLGVFVSGDIGCYTLGAAAPLSAIDTTVCMGASISGLHGFIKADSLLGGEWKGKAVSVIGDSTFLHSGITGLINSIYNGSAGVNIILDNSITGMTGHQNNPSNAKDIYGDPSPFVNLEALCNVMGVPVKIIDPYNISETEREIKSALEADTAYVIIARKPCALLKDIEKKPPLVVEGCKSCKVCLKIGCPALSFSDKTAVIDKNSCNGCGVCASLCKFGAIKSGEGASKK